MRTWLLTFFLVFLISCAPMADGRQQTADGRQPTATPLSTPTATPTLTPTLTPTPTPTPLPHPAAFDDAFARGLIRYENGQWLVTAVETVDGGRQTADFVLLPDTFNTHDDLRARNPLAPLTVRARPLTPTPLPLGDPLTGAGGQGVREYTLIYHPDTAEFRVAYTFPTLFEGIGTDSPRLIEENLDAIPFIPIEDIQNGLAAQSVLLAMQESGYQPFSENTRLGENRLHFELRKNGLKTAELLSLANLDLKLDVEHHPIKVTPFLFKTQLNGQEVLLSSIAILNPANHENWSPDEFIITFGINYPQIEIQSFTNFFKSGSHFLVNSLYLYATNPNLDPKDPNTILIPNPSNPDNPTLLDARDPFQSLLVQLLGIEGYDIRQYENPVTPGIDFSYWIDWGLAEITRNGTGVAEIYDPNNPNFLIDEIQTMGPFPFEVGVAQ